MKDTYKVFEIERRFNKAKEENMNKLENLITEI